MKHSILASLFAGLCLSGPAISQEAPDLDPALLAGMKFRSIGPAGMSGRVAAIDVVADNPRIVYVGAATGGLWRSADGGVSFTALFDDQDVASIGAVAVDQNNPDTIWVGTGEGNPRNSASVGRGMYRSLDGGRTWIHLGLERTERIHRVVLHPNDPQTVWVAALGTTWGENEQRGVFRTTDGGASWKKVLYVDERTGCADLVIDPGNPHKLFAAMWDHRRWPWSLRSGGPGSGLYRSVNGGVTWQRLQANDGLPKGELGRIGLAISRSEPNIVYALVEAKKSALLRSDDGGYTWRTVNRDTGVAPRPFYYADIRVDPENPNRIYSLHSLIEVSEDGGKSLRVLVPFNQAHPDHHAMWIDPDDCRHLWIGNDGGVYESRDRGESWRFARNLPLAQFYHISVDHDEPYNVYGGLQDNGSWRGPSQVWENGGIRNHHWEEVGFGDGFATLADPDDSMQGYAMSQGGSLMRWNLRIGERKGIRPWSPEDTELRFNWNAGIAQDPFDPDTIYYGSQFVHRSTDRGDSWEILSPDLTSNNPEWQKQEESGGLTRDVTGAENFTTILTIVPSPLERGLIWAGTDDGRVHVTRDGGRSWVSVEGNIPELPGHTWCPHIEPSKFDAGTAFAVFDDHRRSNWTPYVYRTDDYGASWRSLATEDLDGYCLVIEQDPVQENLLFLGTEFGLFVSLDGGAKWFKWTHGFPTVSAMAMTVHPRDHDLIVGTHGRAAYVLDDIGPLRSLSAETLGKALHLFPIPPAVAYRVAQTGASRFPGQGEFRGENRPRGALITLSVHGDELEHPDPEVQKQRGGEVEEEPEEKEPEDAAAKKKVEDRDSVTVEVRDAEDEVVRTFKAKVKLGVNRIVWNLRRDGVQRPSRTIVEPPDVPPPGAEVLPGDYRVTLRFGEHEATSSVTVRPDPRVEVPWEQRVAKDEAVRASERLLADMAGVADAVARAKRSLEIMDQRIALEKKGKDDDSQKPLEDALKDARKAVKQIEEKLWGPDGEQGISRRGGWVSEMSRGFRSLSSSWDAPTEAERIGLERAREHVTEAAAGVNEFLAGPMAEFRKAVAAAELELVPELGPVEVGSGK